MAFTVTEFRDLVRILRLEPERREELRRLVLTDELLTLPQKFEALDAKVTSLDIKVTSIAETQQQGQKELAEFQSWTRQRFDEVDERFNKIDERFNKVDDDLGRLKGDNLEARYRERPFVYQKRGEFERGKECPLL